MKPIVIGICGKSASGKDYTATRLVEEYKKIGIPAKKVISYTTRPPREGEVDGVDYHFVDLETFIEMQYDNKFIEHNEFKLWNKLRSTYDKELNFIYIKNLYEDDIIRYFKQHSYIENLLSEQSSVILDNPNKTELNYPYNIVMLDAIIHEI